MRRLSYRPEVDGLRALAVLGVLFFHNHLKFPGGYVGVDIFFVISGYLITSLIVGELNAGTFSLRNFWERRIRRIVPAATVTVAVCLVLGFFLMLPSDFAELGRSAVAQVLIAANIYFYTVSGYFAAPEDSKPLLHFWSLAVEEQFYLIFPFVLLLLYARRRKWMSRDVGMIALASFALSVVGVVYFPDATFYFLPTRVWELALGAILALRRDRLPLPESTRGMMGWLGMTMMIVPMFLYDTMTPFPGLAAVPPCIGAMLVIWATNGATTTVLKRLLSLRPVVFVGLLSYSLYLWHWPAKVFSHYWFTGLYSPPVMRVMAATVGFGLAWLSWRYVELPFRNKRRVVPMRPFLASVAAASALTLVAGVAISRWEGLPERFPSAVERYDAAYDDRPKIEEADLTAEDAEQGNLPKFLDRPRRADATVLVWGDSHARVVSPAVEAICRERGVQGYRASRSGVAPMLDWGNPEMRRHNEAVLRWVEEARPTVVVLAARWEKVLVGPEDESSLRVTVETLRARGVEVALMRQVATQQRDIPKMLARTTLLGGQVDEVGILVEEHEQLTRRSNEMIDRVLAVAPQLVVLDPIPYLSRDGRCIAEESGRALYYDRQHLTTYGAAFLQPMFETLIRRIAPQQANGIRRKFFAMRD